MPTITRKAKNTGLTGGRSLRGAAFRPTISPSRVVRDDETAELRHADFVAIAFVRPHPAMRTGSAALRAACPRCPSIAASLTG